MKYKDSHKYMRSHRDKFGNKKPDPNSWWEKEERKRKKAENKAKREFVKKIYKIDKHWVKTLSEEEMKDLYWSWNWNIEMRDADDNQWFTGGESDDGNYATLKDFIKGKKPRYGSVKEARDLKIEDLFSE